MVYIPRSVQERLKKIQSNEKKPTDIYFGDIHSRKYMTENEFEKVCKKIKSSKKYSYKAGGNGYMNAIRIYKK